MTTIFTVFAVSACNTRNKGKKAEEGEDGLEADFPELAWPKKRRSRPGTGALREIRNYQQSTDLLLLKLLFSRIVKEVASKYCILVRGLQSIRRPRGEGHRHEQGHPVG